MMQRGGQGCSTGAQWAPVVQTASRGDSSDLLPSSKALEQQLHQHSQTSVICAADTIVGSIVRTDSPCSFPLMAKPLDQWHDCFQLMENTQLLLSQAANCQDVSPRCGDKRWPLPPRHLCPCTAKSGGKRVSAGESSFQEHIPGLSHHCGDGFQLSASRWEPRFWLPSLLLTDHETDVKTPRVCM